MVITGIYQSRRNTESGTALQNMAGRQPSDTFRHHFFTSAKAKLPPPKPGAERNRGRTGTVIIFFGSGLCWDKWTFKGGVALTDELFKFSYDLKTGQTKADKNLAGLLHKVPGLR